MTTAALDPSVGTATPRERGQPRPFEWLLLLLLALPLLVGSLDHSLVVAQRLTIVRADLWVLLIVPLGVIVSAVLSARLPRADQTLLPVTLLLSGLGTLMLTRLSQGTSPDFAARQVMWVTVGCVALLVTVLLPDLLNILRRYKYTVALFGFLLIVGTIVHGVDINGSGYRRWFGFGGIYFQPVEVLKIVIVVFFAAYLDDHQEVLASAELLVGRLRLPPFQYLLPLFIMWGTALILLVVQNDLGSALLFFGIFLAMIYVGAPRQLYTGIAASIFVIGVVLAYRIFPHVRERAMLWLDPWPQAHDTGYQIVQGLIAFANGGLLGTGLGQGMPTVIPAVRTDFIFAAIGEEWGFVGALLVLACYGALLVIGLRMALLCTSVYERLLAVGLTATLAIQTFVILGGNLRVIPLTGVTLPFVSYGGSSILANYIIVGLLLRLSQRARRV